MLRSKWLNDLVSRASGNSTRRKSRSRRERSRRWSQFSRPLWASLEQLEDRRLLAVITVTSLADNTTVNGQVTLREAIIAANTNTSVDGSTAGSGADTIVFNPALFSGGDQTITLT